VEVLVATGRASGWKEDFMRAPTKWVPLIVAFSVCGFGVWLNCRAQESPPNMRGVRPFCG